MTYTIRPLLNGTCQVAGHHAYYQGDPEARYTFLLLVWLIEGPEGPMLVDTGLTHVDDMNQGAAHVLAEPIFRVDQLESGVPIGIWHDLNEARQAIDKLNARQAIILPSHDPDVFARFPEGVIG